MSSSPPPEPRRARRWSLRAKLLGALVGLLAVVCVIVGVVTEVAVYQFQLHQLDGRLKDAGARTQTAFGGQHRRPPQGTPVPPPIQGPGTLTTRIEDGTVDRAEILDAHGDWVPLSATQVAVLVRLPVDGRVH